MASPFETVGNDAEASGDPFAASMLVFGRQANVGSDKKRARAFLPGLEAWLRLVKIDWVQSNFRRSPKTVVSMVRSLVDHDKESAGSLSLAVHINWHSLPRG